MISTSEVGARMNLVLSSPKGHVTRAVSLFLLGLAALLAVACGVSGGSPVAPTSTTPSSTPQTWALSGQSNAVLFRPALSTRATIVGAATSGESIRQWAVDGYMWAQLRLTLSPDVSAFIWLQGESDADYGLTPNAPLTSAYVDRLRDLVARVRSLTRPVLLVIVCGLANAPHNQTEFDAFRAEQRRFVMTDANAVYASTLDLPSEGSQHLTSYGYEMLARRIARAVACYATGDSQPAGATAQNPPSFGHALSLRFGQSEAFDETARPDCESSRFFGRQ